MKTKPVCETDKHGNKRWYINYKLHREDGPAIEHANGSKSWHLNSKPYTPSAHEVIIYKMKQKVTI
jgi:hypothetical protein